MSAEYQVHGDVAVITLNNPPSTAWPATRQGSPTAWNGPMRCGREGHRHYRCRKLSQRADIRSLAAPSPAEPNLLSVILAIENSSKPVIAAVHSVPWRRLELSLGCHYRIAAPGCNVALPKSSSA